MARRRNIFSELVFFMRETKAYWLVPILIIVVLLGVFMILTQTSAAPFIYTLF